MNREKIINGRPLTKAQKRKIRRLEAIFKSLEKENVEPLVLEGGGSCTLVFFRDADLRIEALEKSNRTQGLVYENTSISIVEYVP